MSGRPANPSWRRVLQSAALGLCLLFVLSGCARRAPATPAIPTVPATVAAATASPTMTASASSASGTAPRSTEPTVFVSPRHGYTVTLPCCWVGMSMTPLDVEAALDELDPTPAAETGDLGDALPEIDLTEALELVAILPDSETKGAPKAQLTVSVLTGHGLTLDQYLEATVAELTAIANTHVLDARLDASLRPDNVPVVMIEYQTTAARPVAGLQIAFYLDDTDNLAILTFTTDQMLYADLAADFADIARQVTPAGTAVVKSPG